MFNFPNIFDILNSRTQKISWEPPVFKHDFYIFSYNEQLEKVQRNFMDKFLLYHTYLKFYNYSVTKFFTSLENSVFFLAVYILVSIFQ